MKPQKREVYWDLVKGLAIIVVVFAHSGYNFLPVINTLGRYELLIFFFVSGFLYNEKYSSKPYEYIGKKLRKLWWPYIKYVLFFILFHNIFLKLNIYSSVINQPLINPVFPHNSEETLSMLLAAVLQTSYSSQMAGALWFVMPLFVSMTTFCLIRHSSIKLNLINLSKELYTLLLVSIVSVIGFIYISQAKVLPWRSDVAFITISIVYSGFLTKKYWKRISLNLYFFIVSMTIIYLSYRQGAELKFFPSSIKNIPLLFAGSFSSIYAYLYISKILNLFKIPSKIVSHLGEKSFHIMALHFLSFKLINWVDVTINNKPRYMIAQFAISNSNWWILYLLSGLILPVLASFTYEVISKKLVNFRKKNKSII